MKKYDNYKDSGIEWIGEIPEHWSVGKLKYFCDKITDGSHYSPPTIEKGKRYLSVKDVGNNKLLFDDCKKISEEEFDLLVRNGCQPIKGDILLTKDGTIGRAVIVQDDNDFVVLSSLGIIRPNETKFNSTFLREFLVSDLNVDQMLSLLKGSALTRITISVINGLFVTNPPIEEQKIIANYLDHKTTQIDTLITKKEQFISLLQEERTAVINQAVTKGLDPKVPMKDSGIEWLGEIPEHWEVKKLAFEFNTLNTKRIPLSAEERGRMELRKYDYYGASGVIDKVENYIFDEDLILIGEDGANLLTRSKRLVFIASGKYWVNNHAHIIKPIHGNINYFCELLELIDYTIYISGSAQPKLTQEALMSIKIPVPPTSEQDKIFDFLNKEFSKIDTILSKTQQEIELLKEYKTALISEVVTGKVDVRNEILN